MENFSEQCTVFSHAWDWATVRRALVTEASRQTVPAAPSTSSLVIFNSTKVTFELLRMHDIIKVCRTD